MGLNVESGKDVRTEKSSVELSGSELGEKQKNLKRTDLDTPVQAYEDATEVPAEFLIKDFRTLSFGYGDDDAHLDLPMIDMSALLMTTSEQQQSGEAVDKLKAEIGKVCEEWGFFQAINHGIPESLLDQVIDVGKEFFRMPLEEKQVYAVSPGEVEGYGRVSSFNNRFWNDMMRHTVRPKPTPENDRSPDKPVAYRPLIEEYTKGIEKVADAVWISLSEYMGLESMTLKDAQATDPQLVMRMNFYPKCPEPEKVDGLSPHQDLGSMTMLLQDNVWGLQVRRPDNADVWVDVKPRKGVLLVIIGKQIEVLSNCRFKGVYHRALVNRTASRLSVAGFFNPGPKCVIRPIPELIDEAHPPLFKSLIYGDILSDTIAHARQGLRFFAHYEINR